MAPGSEHGRGRGKRGRSAPRRGKFKEAVTNTGGVKVDIHQELPVTETLPAELLTEVFKHLLPTHPVIRKGLPITLRYRRQLGEEIAAKYRNGLAEVAALRLVCRFWAQTITPMVYRTATIFTNSLSDIGQNTRWFERHAQFVRVVILDDLLTRPSEGMTRTKIGRAVKKVAQLLKCCLNLQQIHSYGNTFTFLYTKWVQRTLPGLPLTIKRLILRMSTTTMLLSSLSALGCSLEKLEIHHLRGMIDFQLELPAPMQNLRQLTLSDGLYPNQLRGLFSRICLENSSSSTIQSPLRSLSVLSVRGIDGLEFISLLRTNRIGQQLTFLHVEPVSIWAVECVIAIVKECKMLTEFSYTGPISKTLFGHLSENTFRLSLPVYTRDSTSWAISSAEDFLDLVGLPALRHLTIIKMKPLSVWLSQEKQQLEDACRTADIELQWTYSSGN